MAGLDRLSEFGELRFNLTPAENAVFSSAQWRTKADFTNYSVGSCRGWRATDTAKAPASATLCLETRSERYVPMPPRPAT